MITQRGILVTGSASGLGLAIAHGFAAQGHRLLLADVNPAVNDVAKALPAAQAIVVDLSKRDQVLKLGASAREFGCDVVVNNAGVSPMRNGEAVPPAEIDMDDWDTVLQINLTAPFMICSQLIPAMQARKFGRIVNIASRAGRTYIPASGAHYAASKAAILGLTRQLAGHYGPDGITANCIAPGRIVTPLSSNSSARIVEQALQHIPVRRLGEPNDIAATAVFLASDGAGFINGACIDVNGGAFMS